MEHKQETKTGQDVETDVYEIAQVALKALIEELCDALGVKQVDSYKRTGYEMVAANYKQPVHTGELTLIFATVLEDILYKLEVAQQGENVKMVRDDYTVMKIDHS